jgi:hypothetical protein
MIQTSKLKSETLLSGQIAEVSFGRYLQVHPLHPDTKLTAEEFPL